MIGKKKKKRNLKNVGKNADLSKISFKKMHFFVILPSISLSKFGRDC